MSACNENTDDFALENASVELLMSFHVNVEQNREMEGDL